LTLNKQVLKESRREKLLERVRNQSRAAARRRTPLSSRRSEPDLATAALSALNLEIYIKGDIMNPVHRDAADLPQANAKYIVPPFENNVRSFEDGNINIVHLNTFGEPAGGASYLLVLFPRKAGPEPHSRLVSPNSVTGFGNIEFAEIESSYNVGGELTIRLPVTVFDGKDFIAWRLILKINRDEETMTVALLSITAS
jgi:hypothetical protein